MYKVIQLEQGSDAWLSWREGGIGASDMPTIMGESPYKTPLQLWREKMGLAETPDLSNNPHVRRGVENEEPARQAFDARFNEFTLEMCIESRLHPHRRVSLDGLTASGKVLEIKCPTPEKAQQAIAFAQEQGTKPVTRQQLESLGLYYWAQVQYQLAVVGLTEAVLWVWDVESQQGAALVIQAEPEYQEALLAAADAFWDCIVNAKAPEPDPNRDVLFLDASSASEKWAALEAQIKPLKEQLKELESEQKEVAQELVAELGDRYIGEWSNGLRLTRFTRRGRLDYAKLLDEIAPDIPEDVVEGFRGKSTESMRITLKAN